MESALCLLAIIIEQSRMNEVSSQTYQQVKNTSDAV